MRREIWLVAALACVAAVYWNALQAPFVRDDHLLIEEEPRVRELRSLDTYLLGGFWTNPTGPVNASYYRPLTTLSYALDYRLWSGAPRGFHTTNLLLHLCCVAAVYALCRRRGVGALPAGLAAALFGSLPRGTEAVTWISGRTDVLATLGALVALLVHSSEPDRHGRRMLAATALLAGLLGKEVAAAGGAAIVALELESWRRERWPLRRGAIQLAPLAAAGVSYAALRWLAGASGAFPDVFGWPLRVLLCMQALGTYAVMLVDPLRPRLFIGQLGIIQPPLVLLGVAVSAVLVLAFARIARGRSRPWQSALLLLGVCGLVPVLHLIPLPVRVVAADRFLFLPAAALAIAGACGARRLPQRWTRAVGAAAFAALALFGLSTHLRNRIWQDELELWTLAVRNAPAGSSEAHRELATVLSWRGQPERALEYFLESHERAWEFARKYPRAGVDQNLRSNLALVLSEVGRFDEAIPILQGLLREKPRSPTNHLHLAAVHARRLDFDAAERGFQNALELHPDYELAERLLAQVRRARILWERLPQQAEDEPPEAAAARAFVYHLVGRLDQAERAWTRVALDPRSSLDHVRRAAHYLAHHARDVDAAHDALERLSSMEGAARDAQHLSRILDARQPGLPPA